MRALSRILNVYLRRRWTGRFSRKACGHLHMLADVAPSSDGCEACVTLGDGWPALRMCATCGFVGCCDESKNRHALRHYEETGHPLIRPHGERLGGWIWCRIDQTLLDADRSANRSASRSADRSKAKPEPPNPS